MHTHKVINIFLGLLTLVILFHFTILAKVVPYDIAWGGRLQNDSEMYVFEAASICINLLLMLVLVMKARYISFTFGERALNIILWIFFALFVLNSIGNLFAKTTFERSFTALTLIFAILIWIIVKPKRR